MSLAKVIKMSKDDFQKGEVKLQFVPFKRIEQFGGYTLMEVAELVSYSILRISDFEEVEDEGTTFYHLVSVNYIQSDCLHLVQTKEDGELGLYSDTTGYTIKDGVDKNIYSYEGLIPRKVETTEKVDLVDTPAPTVEEPEPEPEQATDIPQQMMGEEPEEAQEEKKVEEDTGIDMDEFAKKFDSVATPVPETKEPEESVPAEKHKINEDEHSHQSKNWKKDKRKNRDYDNKNRDNRNNKRDKFTNNQNSKPKFPKGFDEELFDALIN